MANLSQSDKRIAINTIIIYIRMVFVAVIGFLTTRYVLQALGVSDFGLYNVVGGIVTIMSFVSIAMMTTTRRFINIEIGKSDGGDLNKIFNVSFILHICFAILIYLLALTIGLWYIYNYLNVDEGKLQDAVFVFFISCTVSAIGIVNVPFQALMTAFERFKQIAIIDISTTFLKIPLVILLLIYVGNHLRFYAIGMCVIVFFSLILYHIYCKRNFREIIEFNFYRDWVLYKEILYFNNYTAMGALAYIARSNGSTMVINYFFGTIVNGAYAIAVQIESQIQSLVVNLNTAANPQMTQSYGAGNFQRSFDLVIKVSRFGFLFMILMCFPILVELEFLLGLWLKQIPEGSVVFCQAMLISLLLRSLGGATDPFIQATGRVKWYQISQSSFLVLGIPMAIYFFIQGLHPVYIVISFIICDLLRTITMFIIICKITNFDIRRFAISVYYPVFKIIIILVVYYIIYNYCQLESVFDHIAGFVVTFSFTSFLCVLLGMTSSERKKIAGKLLKTI